MELTKNIHFSEISLLLNIRKRGRYGTKPNYTPAIGQFLQNIMNLFKV